MNIWSNWHCINVHTGQIRPVQSLQEFTQRDHGEWRVWLQLARAEINGLTVSTIFLGLDHGWYAPRPVLFETMIFGGALDEEQWRYCELGEALHGHRRAVFMAKLARYVGGRLAILIGNYCWKNTMREE